MSPLISAEHILKAQLLGFLQMCLCLTASSLLIVDSIRFFSSIFASSTVPGSAVFFIVLVRIRPRAGVGARRRDAPVAREAIEPAALRVHRLPHAHQHRQTGPRLLAYAHPSIRHTYTWTYQMILFVYMYTVLPLVPLCQCAFFSFTIHIGSFPCTLYSYSYCTNSYVIPSAHVEFSASAPLPVRCAPSLS